MFPLPRSRMSLALLLLSTPALGQEVGAPEALAHWELPVKQAAVGEPVQARLVVEHAAGARVELSSPVEDGSWVLFDRTAPWTESAGPGRARTAWEFRWASLEAGSRSLPAATPTLGGQALEVEGATLFVAAVLGEGEDAPRPLRDAPPLPAETEGPLTWIAAGVLLLLGVLLGAWILRRRRAAPPATASPPSARLSVLEAADLAQPADVQSAHYAMTRLLRESADLGAGVDRSALTDEEWAARAEGEFRAAGLSEGERATLQELLLRAAAVKYGPERPTHWATRESLARARALALRFEARASSAGLAGADTRREEAA